MQSYKPILKSLFKQLFVLYILYTICRILFFVFNKSSFHDIEPGEFFSLLLYGLRFDSFSIAATNALYILLCILPFRFYYSKPYQNIRSVIFITFNSFAILLNFVDFAFFPYIQKRMTYDVVHMIFGGQSDFLNLLPHFLLNFWYLVILYGFLIGVMVKMYFKIKQQEKPETIKPNAKIITLYGLVFLSLVATTVLGIRGGLQRIPIVLLDAANYTKPNYIPALINTPFSILKSAELTELKELTFFDARTLKNYYNPIHQPDTGTFRSHNICIIILESFSKEFTGLSNRKSFTPFLDSLMTQSIVYRNGISNGKTSINGIPAIVASMPSFLEDNYLNSIYSNNTIQTLPSLLKNKGYTSVFYHGGTNGTMNFNSFAKLAGYDSYYGRSEYNDDTEYDGQWGIWDEPFLKRTVKEMSKLKEPFFTSIFTLSSHNPYKIPEKYEGKFPKGTMQIHQCVGYTDYALKQFFAEAKKQPWFNNTLFVLSPDHTSVSDDPFYSNLFGQYAIPIVFYKHNITPKVETKTVQQIDILPGILDYLNYDQPYYSLGKSLFSDQKQPALFYNAPNFYCVQDSSFFIMNNYHFIEKYNINKDSLLKTNLWNKEQDKDLQNFCRAYIQTYTHDVINNKTWYNRQQK